MTRARLESKGATVVGFGHIGDGNVHLNISTPEYDEEVLRMIEPWVFEWTHKVCHYMTQPLVELYGGCMLVLKVS